MNYGNIHRTCQNLLYNLSQQNRILLWSVIIESVYSVGCFAKMTSGKPGSMVYRCPCTAGLTCHGSGLYEVPLGEKGTYVSLSVL